VAFCLRSNSQIGLNRPQYDRHPRMGGCPTPRGRGAAARTGCAATNLYT
jgi:hypothetical protein